MVTPDGIGNALGNFFDASILTSALAWTGYIVLGLLVAGGFFAFFIMLQYKYKLYYYQIAADFDEKEDKGVKFKLGKMKRDFARAIKDQGVDKWQLLMLRKKIQPPKFEHIAEGNKVYMIRTGPETFLPAQRTLDFVVGNHVTENLMPLDADIKFWEQNEIQQAAMDFMKDGYHKQLLMIAAGVIVAILIFSAVAIWFNLQAAQSTVQKIDIVSGAISNLKSIGPG